MMKRPAIHKSTTAPGIQTKLSVAAARPIMVPPNPIIGTAIELAISPNDRKLVEVERGERRDAEHRPERYGEITERPFPGELDLRSLNPHPVGAPPLQPC